MPRYKEAIVGRKSIHNDKKLTYTEAIERSLYEKLFVERTERSLDYNRGPRLKLSSQLSHL